MPEEMSALKELENIHTRLDVLTKAVNALAIYMAAHHSGLDLSDDKSLLAIAKSTSALPRYDGPSAFRGTADNAEMIVGLIKAIGEVEAKLSNIEKQA